MNFRTSLDTYTYVSSNGIGATINFKAGYDIFASTGTGALITSSTMTQTMTYNVKDLAVALTATIAASSVLSLVF